MVREKEKGRNDEGGDLKRTRRKKNNSKNKKKGVTKYM